MKDYNLTAAVGAPDALNACGELVRPGVQEISRNLMTSSHERFNLLPHELTQTFENAEDGVQIPGLRMPNSLEVAYCGGLRTNLRKIKLPPVAIMPKHG